MSQEDARKRKAAEEEKAKGENSTPKVMDLRTFQLSWADEVEKAKKAEKAEKAEKAFENGNKDGEVIEGNELDVDNSTTEDNIEKQYTEAEHASEGGSGKGK